MCNRISRRTISFWLFALGGTLPFSTAESQSNPAAAAPGIYFEFQVAKKVALLPGNPTPRYPDMLRSSNVQGEVLAQFVVDTTGHADTTTLKVLRSTHDMFTNSVRHVLPNLQFSAAEIAGGRKVKQLVQMPFQFNLTAPVKPPPSD